MTVLFNFSTNFVAEKQTCILFWGKFWWYKSCTKSRACMVCLLSPLEKLASDVQAFDIQSITSRAGSLLALVVTLQPKVQFLIFQTDCHPSPNQACALKQRIQRLLWTAKISVRKICHYSFLVYSKSRKICCMLRNFRFLLVSDRW